MRSELEVVEKYRMDEKYIDVKESGWESRYYRRKHGKVEKEEIVKRYIEGLEWVYKYYTVGCKSWRWKKLEGAPLLKDLKVEKVKIEESEVMSMEEQIEYVMPKEEKKIELEWAYKRYNWECDVKITE